MGIIQDRIDEINRLIENVKNHHMWLYFTETPTHYVVQYPDGYFPEGVRSEKGNNKTIALGRLLPVMDKHWGDSCFWRT